MNTLIYFSLLTNILYGLLLYSYFLKWRQRKHLIEYDEFTLDKLPSLTIVVPFRNEENNLPNLLKSLKQINYPKNKLEFIFVNDHSEDNSLAMLENNFSDFKLFSLSESFGKKAALDLGIRKANGEWIVTIDADVSFESDWLITLIQPSINSDIVMICGLVRISYDDHKWWSKFQAMEFAVLQASGAAAIMQGRALLNSGANLAFRKDIWLQLGAYNSHKHLASGDDTFLLFEMNKQYPGKVFSATNSIVTTSSEISFKKLIQQRLRWSGKTIHYKDSYVWMVGVIVVLSSFLTVINLISLPFFKSQCVILTLIILSLRLIPEWLLLNTSLYDKKRNFRYYDKLLMTLFYPFFIVLLLSLQPFNKISWKGRQL